MKNGKKIKRKTKIIISVIIAFCIILGGIFIFLGNQNKSKVITLSQTQINTDTNILNEFINSITSNDEGIYKSLTVSTMNENNTFNTIISDFKSLGKLKSVSYDETVKIGNYYDVIFNTSFTNKDNVTLVLSLNNDNKIVGIHT